MRAIGSWGVVLAILAAYPLVAFYPYAFYVPAIYANGARADGGAAEFSRHGLLASPTPPAWLRGVAAGNGFAVELEVVPESGDQRGPARILTVSRGATARNLTIAQAGDALIVRLRSPRTTANGLPELVIPAVFEAGTPRRIAISAIGDTAAMTLRISIDGIARAGRPLGARAFAGWDTTMGLALGNEIGAPRPWRGVIRTATVQTGGATYDYLRAGRLERPPLVWYPREINIWLLLVSGDAADAAMNLFGFIPLGLMCAALLFVQLGRAMALVAGASLAIEAVQYFIPARVPSLADLLLNIAGGAIGIAVFIILWRRWPGLWRILPARPI